MPKKPRWLLAIPDAIKQLDRLKRDQLTRRDLEVLFGVSKVTAAKQRKLFPMPHGPVMIRLWRSAIHAQVPSEPLAKSVFGRVFA